MKDAGVPASTEESLQSVLPRTDNIIVITHHRYETSLAGIESLGVHC